MIYFVDINNWVYSDLPHDVPLSETERQCAQSRRFRVHRDRSTLHSVRHITLNVGSTSDIFKIDYQTPILTER